MIRTQLNRSLSRAAIAFCLLWSLCARAQTSTPADVTQVIENANSLLKEGKLDDAQQAAEQAIKTNPANYLGYAVEAKIASKQGHIEHAKELIDTALTLAPDTDKDKVRQLAAMLNSGGASTASAPTGLSDEDQLKADGLMLILNNADKAQNADDRNNAYRDFLTRSVDFAVAHLEQTNIWLMRAFACVQLDYPGEGFLAGQHLKALGAIHSEDPKVRRLLAELESKGWLGDKRTFRDWSKWTIDQATAAANAGDEEAQFALGEWYSRGESGLSKNDAEAANWYGRAANQGNAAAEKNLGILYETGRGVQRDYAQAVLWCRKAADQGDVDAECCLGGMYANGNDYAQAVYWFRKAADQGDAQGQENLALSYEIGIGVKQDFVQAASWYRRAADQSNVQAEASLGTCYEYGNGVAKDYTQALSWFLRAAAQGDFEGAAESNLGCMYERGWGVDKDITKAKEWYQKAAAQGNLQAVTALKQLDTAQ